MKKGYLQVYTGNGKGKTTAAIGLAVRGAGAQLNVVMAQFLKAMDTSELNVLNKIENIKIMRYATNKKFVWDMNDEEKAQLKSQMNKLFEDTVKFAKENKSDIVIFDELLGAYHGGFIRKEDIVDLIENRPETCEYVITGRKAPDWLMDKAHLVTCMEGTKHYIDMGVKARKGIEF